MKLILFLTSLETFVMFVLNVLAYVQFAEVTSKKLNSYVFREMKINTRN